MWPDPVRDSLIGMTTTAAVPDLKARHRTMWASGDYPLMVDTFLLPVGQRLADALPITPGVRVLDVAAGTGNASVPAAQRGAHVTATDLTPELLEAGAQRPEAQGLDLDWVPADAEDLPFEEDAFDIVMSCIGVMFAPFHQTAADELVRVCRPGGTIGLLSWTPEGMIGGLFRTHEGVRPAPAGGGPGAAAVGQRGAPGRPVRRPGRAHHAGPRARWRSPPSRSRRTGASTSRPTTARPSPPGRTPTATAARPSSTRRWRPSAPSGTGAPRTRPTSSRSTCSRWGRASSSATRRRTGAASPSRADGLRTPPPRCGYGRRAWSGSG